jgi:hypothetical protein
VRYWVKLLIIGGRTIMDNPEHESILNSLLGKAEHEVDKFMDDPEKVEESERKGRGFFGQAHGSRSGAQASQSGRVSPGEIL